MSSEVANIETAESEAGPSNFSPKPTTGKQQQPRQNNQQKPRNSNMPRLTSEQLRRRLHYIASGSTVILKMPSGRTKAAEIMPGKQVSLGKFGSFKADDLIGMPYGFTYEIQPEIVSA